MATASVQPDVTAALHARASPSSLGSFTIPYLGSFSQIPGAAAAIESAIVQATAEEATFLEKTLEPELYYSYGGSPPVYPTPQGSGIGNWATAYQQARSLVAQMTVEEKANITLGMNSNQGCSGFTGSVPRLGFPGICLNDAESGVRTGSLVNGYPAQLHVGASWSRSLAGDRASYLGREFKAKGINVALGPVVGPLGRIAEGGRNWEGFSPDPYLAGSLVVPTIMGLQQSVIACVKHFITNEQESNREPFLIGAIPELGVQSVSSNLDDRTMHELYLWPFAEAVRAEVGSVMCSYNRVNNSYGCQNSKTMNGLLKTELGFQGFVVSDWNAVLTGIAAPNAGLDMIMPTSQYLSPDVYATAVKNGSMNATRVDDQATRILASWYRYAEYSDPGMDSHASVDARDPAAQSTLLQSAVEGHVLVKNTNRALPLAKPSVLSLFGYDAVGGLNGSNQLFLYPYGLGNTQKYPDGTPFTALQLLLSFGEVDPDPHSGPPIALLGTILGGGGSGAITPTSSIAPFDAFAVQAANDNTTLHYDFTSQNPKVVAPESPCIVFINAMACESWDRAGLSDDYSDTLVTNVASQCRNTMVVMHNAGIRTVDEWINNENVTAVIYAHLPGQDSGNSLVEIMYGRQSPSGRLPYTVAKSASDYGSLLGPTFPDANNPQYPQSNFSEGVFIDYKHFIQQNIVPQFAFGYGLTYATFKYSLLQISRDTSTSTARVPPGSGSGASQGGTDSLYDTVATVTILVTNTANATAAEVAQLYVGIPGSGVPKVLRGFDKHLLSPGTSATFSFPLRRKDLSVWDSNTQQWLLNSGSYNIMVGKSVLDIQLQTTLSI